MVIINNGFIIPELKDAITISIEEKLELEAISMTLKKLPPVPGKHPSVTRDYGCKRLGTLSLLAGIDLHNGAVTETVSRTHNSNDFIGFQKKLDLSYPREKRIGPIFDNRRVHTSTKTR